MTSLDPVEEAKALLVKRRDALLKEVTRVTNALAALGESVDAGPGPPPSKDRPSVRAMVVSLLEEESRDWSAGEILAEYERRGTPVHGMNPSNALRAALADAKKRAMIVSTGVGRYRAAKWSVADPTSNGTPPDLHLGTKEDITLKPL